jgi:hypothetical protein
LHQRVTTNKVVVNCRYCQYEHIEVRWCLVVRFVPNLRLWVSYSMFPAMTRYPQNPNPVT